VKLGKVHLVLSLSLLAVSIVYNAWVWTRPARTTAPSRADAPLIEGLQASGPTVTGDAAAEVIDPTTIPPVPDVGLDRAPEWPRNPFLSTRRRVAETSPVASGEVATEPDLVLASILHSAERRLAILNGRIVGVGDRVGSMTVRAIEPREVVVESSTGARRTLELRVPIRRADK
jgi:hypothetical protein